MNSIKNYSVLLLKGAKNLASLTAQKYCRTIMKIKPVFLAEGVY